MRAGSSFEGRTVAITGAAGGIGRAAALRFAKEGASIALIDIDETALQAVGASVQSMGGRYHIAVTDCFDPDSIKTAFEGIQGSLGSPDILVNNVGQSPGPSASLFADTEFQNLERLIAINLKACLYCSREVLSEMKLRRHGRIVNVSSDAALIGDLMSWDYATAKAGVIGFTRALAREVASSGITVNAVAPGFTRTAMTDAVSEASRARILAGVPTGQIIEPEEVAAVIAFLAADDSRSVTGQTIAINGGRWML
jgi:NAD(P)-dependent dehydrogenase (short-subunit alcohol dehydrogenase family)